jgi:hypothetical protein
VNIPAALKATNTSTGCNEENKDRRLSGSTRLHVLFLDRQAPANSPRGLECALCGTLIATGHLLEGKAVLLVGADVALMNCEGD